METDKETATWLLNLANDMRRRKGDALLEDLPPSIPRNISQCIIANAFNYGCKVKPDEREIIFKNPQDAFIYCEVMGIDILRQKEYDEYLDSEHFYSEPVANEAYIEDYYMVPMTQELVEIAKAFDSGTLFRKYACPE